MVSSVWRQRCGALSFWVIENEIGHLGVLRHPQHHRQVFVDAGEIEHELQARCGLAPCIAAAIAVSSSSPAFSVGVKSPVEVRWLSVREVEKPSAPARTASPPSAAIALLSSGVDGIAARAALAHHVDAQRRMRQLRADIHVEISLRQPLHVIRKAFPGPGNAGAQHRLGDVLDAFHQLDQPDMIGRPARRKADAAIAHDRCGDAVLRRGRDVLAPGDLAVIMGVDVDKAGRDQFAFGVDFFLAFRRQPCRLR